MSSSYIRGYSDNVTGDYLFGVADGDGKGGLGPRINHLYSHKVYFWLAGDYFVSYLSRDYPSTSHSNKRSYSYSLFQMRYNHFSIAGDGRSDVGINTTQSSSQKVDFVRDRHDVWLRKYKNHCTGFPLVS